jgi:hypothetical protein
MLPDRRNDDSQAGAGGEEGPQAYTLHVSRNHDLLGGFYVPIFLEE